MNINELNEIAKVNQKNALEEVIAEIEKYMVWRANDGLNNFKVSTHDDGYYYAIREWMLEPLRDYFIDKGYKVEIKETKDLIKWIGKLLRVCEPEYLMIISW